MRKHTEKKSFRHRFTQNIHPKCVCISNNFEYIQFHCNKIHQDLCDRIKLLRNIYGLMLLNRRLFGSFVPNHIEIRIYLIQFNNLRIEVTICAQYVWYLHFVQILCEWQASNYKNIKLASKYYYKNSMNRVIRYWMQQQRSSENQ